METLQHNISRYNFGREIPWIITIALLAAVLPIFKIAIVFILEKLYELLVQHSLGK